MILAKIPPTPPGTSLAGKVALITGASSGLGLETARQYLLLGVNRLIITARTAAKCREAKEALESDPEVTKTNPNATIDAFELELEDNSSILRFCTKVKTDVPVLHILLNNAGLAVLSHKLSKDDHELTMQVNTYAPMLISHLLLPLLRQTARAGGVPTHLTFTGSGLHTSSKLLAALPPSAPIIPHLDGPAAFSALVRYHDSKLALALLVADLARRTPAPEVVVSHVCPGPVKTGLDRNLPALLRVAVGLFRRIVARDVQEGARTLVYATCVLGEESHGKFVSDNLIRSDCESVSSAEGQRATKELRKELEEEWKLLGV